MTICNRCIMDSSDPNIVFDERGFCNHCTKYYQDVEYAQNQNKDLYKIMEKIKIDCRGKKYDGAIGISGGRDSSYTSYIAHEHGLNLLAIHFNNGYDSPEGTHNVDAVVRNTGWDFEYMTVDPDEFVDLQLAYLKSGVMNLEAISDHAIRASIFKAIKKHKIEYLFGGQNLTTEGIMPKAWTFTFADSTNIRNIHKKFGTIPLKTYPILSPLWWAFTIVYKNIKKITPLVYIDYNITEAREILSREWGWKDYGWKHGENIITRFFQHYIFPRRYGYYKSKAHLSTLICSGQVTRDEALEILEDGSAYSAEMFEEDYTFVLNKLGLSDEEFEGYMNIPPTRHEVYGTYGWKQDLMKIGYYIAKKLKMYSV